MDTERKNSLSDQSQAIFLHTPLGIHLWELNSDDDLILIGSNPAADKFTGIKTSELYGKTIEKAFPGLEGKEQPERYKLVAVNGGTYTELSYPYEDSRINGTYDIWAFQIALNQVVVQFSEVTEQKMTLEALKQSTLELKKK